MKNELSLNRKEIEKGTSEGLQKYKDLNFLERFAMFLGVAQILELGLKNLLSDKFKYDQDKLEKWTLGMTCYELEKNNIRPDFITLLKSVVDFRNYIAHEMLANRILFQTMANEITTNDHYDKESRLLDKAIIELEQLFFLFNWTNSNEAWG